MLSRFTTVAVVCGILGVFTTAQARASLVGATVDVQDLGTDTAGNVLISYDAGSMTVSDTALYPVGSFYDLPFFQVEVTATTLEISIPNTDPAATLSPTIFGGCDTSGNCQFGIIGLVLYVQSTPDPITEAVIDPSSTLAPTGVSLSDGAVYVDFQGLNLAIPPETTPLLTIDLAVVPEPAGVGFLMIGLAGLLAFRRRRAA